MRILLFTGNGGAGVSTAAAATALHAAAQGRRTLLFGVGPSHSLESRLGLPLDTNALQVAPQLDATQVDVARELGSYYQEIRSNLPTLGGSTPSAEELPLPAGFDLFFALFRLRALASSYDLAVIDGGPASGLLRTLSTPDSLRWGMRLLIGLDRGPGQDLRSQLRSILPSSLLPRDQVDTVQNMRVELEQLRDMLTPAAGASTRWVLRLDPAALDEARLAIPALQLHGLAVDALISTQLLPDDIGDQRVVPLIQRWQTIRNEAIAIWQPRPLLRLPWQNDAEGIATLEALGNELYAGQDGSVTFFDEAPIVASDGVEPSLALNLPGVPRGAVSITLSGDELIVGVGTYRRHLLLPNGLRGLSAIRASRDGDQIVIRPRTP